MSTITVILALAMSLTTPPATQPAGADEALLRLLDVERKSQAEYVAIMQRYRPIHPFGMVLRQEYEHQDQIERLLHARGVAVPVNAWAGRAIDLPSDAKAARARAAELEKLTIAAYDIALAALKDSAPKAELQSMRSDSEHHLWMFENCTDGGTRFGPGHASGRGFGRGWRAQR